MKTKSLSYHIYMRVCVNELMSILLVGGNGGILLGCPVSFGRSGRYRFGS